MPRLIILLLIILIMAALAIQNPTSLSLVILGGYRTPEIPLGLILVGAVALGGLLTLILYGLVGLRRPPESKYRPMGQRVPYPNSPGSTTLPPSGPAFGDLSGAPETAPYSRPSSTAFVSEPATTPQDSTTPTPPPANSEQGTASYRAPYENTAYQTAYQDTPSAPENSMPEAVDPVLESEPPSEPRPAIRNPFAQKKKDKGKREESVENKKVGDDWGDLRTAEQLNSWEAIGEASKGARGAGRNPGQNARKQSGFFDSIATGIGLGHSSPQAAGQIADDIAQGWAENSPRPEGDSDRTSYYDEGYGDGFDSGWKNSDSYYSPTDGSLQKHAYNDGLYDDEGPYAEADSSEETGLDGVYEADYRVIEPPSKPLDDRPEEEDGYYSS